MKIMIKKIIISIVIAIIAICSITFVTIAIINRPEKEYTVILKPENGDDITEIKVKKNDQIPLPEKPVMHGCTFAGWYVNNDKWDFASYRVTTNLTLTAKWATTLTIYNYDVDGYRPFIYIKQIIIGDKIDVPNPTSIDKEFVGYQLDLNEWSVLSSPTFYYTEENLAVYSNLPIDSLPEVMPKISITYRAQWNTIKSKVKFVIPPNKEYLIYDNVGTPIDMEEINKTVGSRLGYTFNGWDKTIPEKVPEFNTIITGSWIPDIQYEINNSNNTINITGINKSNPIILSSYEGIPVTKINERAFRNNLEITSITIPEGVTEIGPYAFEGCTNLKSINLPNSLVSIGDGAFNGCKNLTYVKLPENLKTIGANAFRECTNLKKVDFNNVLSEIKANAFSRTALQEVNLSNTKISKINDATFYSCMALQYVYLPKGVTHILMQAFYKCVMLKTFTMPYNLYYIEKEAFYGCESLETLNFNTSLLRIGDSAFKECKSLKTVNLNKGLTEVGKEAFVDCNGFTFLYIPSSILWNEDNSTAFTGCSSLINIKFEGNITAWKNNAYLSTFTIDNNLTQNIDIFCESSNNYVDSDWWLYE